MAMACHRLHSLWGSLHGASASYFHSGQAIQLKSRLFQFPSRLKILQIGIVRNVISPIYSSTFLFIHNTSAVNRYAIRYLTFHTLPVVCLYSSILNQLLFQFSFSFIYVLLAFPLLKSWISYLCY